VYDYHCQQKDIEKLKGNFVEKHPVSTFSNHEFQVFFSCIFKAAWGQSIKAQQQQDQWAYQIPEARPLFFAPQTY